jgi:hypothetical protein
MRELEAKLKALRSKMEYWECFFQDDEVGIALAELEAEFEKFHVPVKQFKKSLKKVAKRLGSY